MTDIFSEIEHDAEQGAEAVGEIFPPRPGGMVAKTRQQNAKAASQPSGEAPAPPRRIKEVPTQERVPEVAVASTLPVSTSLNAGGVRLVGADEDRREITVMTLDEPVVISFNSVSAQDPRNASTAAGQSANGFVLPVNIPVTLRTTAEIWVTATSSTPTRVSYFRVSYGN